MSKSTDMRNLDMNNPGSWPLPAKLGAGVLLALVLIVAAYFAFMVESDKFVRYDVGNDKEVAPGGGKVGMDAAQIRKLYGDRVEEQPHKYVEGGKVLRIKADAGSDNALVFEADATGKVTAWRVGQQPQVDYVEGCS